MKLKVNQNKSSNHTDRLDFQENPPPKTPLKNLRLGLLILLIFSVALAATLFFSRSNQTFISKLAEHFPAVHSPEISSISQDHEKLLPAADYEFLKKLERSQTAVDNAMQTVNDYHKIPWADLDKTAYTDALLAGMDVCVQEEKRIAELDMPSHFEQLTALTSEYINYSNQALISWHDGSSTSNQSTMDQGIHFYEQALEKRKQYFIDFENYLKSMGYTYEKQGDRIIYQYES